MAEIVNQRDLILQSAEFRIIPVPPPEVIIIPGFTGISLVSDVSMWCAIGDGHTVIIFIGAGRANGFATLNATLKGIPPGTPVKWESNVPLTDTPDPLIKLIDPKNYPSGGFIPNPNPGHEGQVIPLLPPESLITVSVDFGPQTFTATVKIEITFPP